MEILWRYLSGPYPQQPLDTHNILGLGQGCQLQYQFHMRSFQQCFGDMARRKKIQLDAVDQLVFTKYGGP